MTEGDGLAAQALARVEQDAAGLLRIRGKVRRLPPEVRALAVYALRGRRVVATTKHGRVYPGQLIEVAETTDGNVSHVALIADGRGFPVALSLATVDELREVDQ